MKYRNQIICCCSPEQFSDWLKLFINNNRLIFKNILPEPTDIQDSDAWRLENWGTTQDSVEVTVSGTDFYFDTENGSLLELLTRIAELDNSRLLIYRYASEIIPEDVGSIEFDCGRLMQVEDIKNPALFACTVWHIEYSDYVCKKSQDLDKNISAFDVEALCLDDDEDVIDSLLSLEDF